MVPRRGFRHPPSYHIDRLREAPVGHFYDVITTSFGAMPDYPAQVPPRDRWAIIAYIRALHFSQHAPLAGLPDVDGEGLGAGGTGGPTPAPAFRGRGRTVCDSVRAGA